MRKNKKVVVISYLILVALLILAGIEAALRIGVIPQPTYYSKASTKVTLDRKLLFRLVPHSNPEINNYGYRDDDFTEVKNDNKRILFLGDSFIFGIGVYSSQTMPSFTERLLGSGYEVYNMGMYGYGPDQSLMQLMTDGLKFDPDIVILGIFAANDFEDIYKDKLFLTDENGRLKYNTTNIVASEISNLDTIYLYKFLKYKYGEKDLGREPSIYSGSFRKLFHTLMEDGYSMDLIEKPGSWSAKKKTELMKAILKEFNEILKKKGIPFIVVVIPSSINIQDDSIFKGRDISPDRYFVNEQTVASICEKESIPYVDLSQPFLTPGLPYPLFDERYDNHLSPYGNFFAAKNIVPHVLALK